MILFSKLIVLGLFVSIAVCIGNLFSCAHAALSNQPTISHIDWGQTKQGTPVKLFTLTNRHGMRVSVTTFGATIQSIYVPDYSGHADDVILGFPDVAGYEKDTFGQTIGRYANRIAHGRFTLDGKTYQLQTNPPWPALHGGGIGFHMRVWHVDSASIVKENPTLVLSYDSPDGDQNFPGELRTTATFTLKPDNELRIDFRAVTSKPTLVNLTEHTYFNLAGDSSGDVLNQLMMINADKFTPTDSMLVPSGKFENVARTPLDFRKPTPIGAHINDKFFMMPYGHGYDFNFVLNRIHTHDVELAAKAEDINSGRILEVWTTQPGVQFYSANWLNSSEAGVTGKKYGHHQGFALECQHFPDSPNHKNFPTTELDPGQKYHQVIEYRFKLNPKIGAG